MKIMMKELLSITSCIKALTAYAREVILVLPGRRLRRSPDMYV